MSARRRDVAISLFLAAGSFALAFIQRPGLATADTKINLHVDPGRFLADVASMWTSTGQLGDVQSGQQAGYLFPMGPFFALGHALGLSAWVVQRLWLGTVLALGAWGIVRLLDALHERPRGIAQLTAGAVFLLNPFVVTYVNRTTVTLLAYAALPWLLLAVHRGLREPRGWRWPAAAALLIAASGGGVNGAVTAWMLVGPVVLLGYEAWVLRIGRGPALAFLVRAVPLIVLASLWWLIPAYVQSSYGVDFLHFTEQPGTVWGTTSATESLRLMSFWLSYVGIGFAGRTIPYFDDAKTLLFSAPVVVATLLLPAAALGSFVWTRRWRYGPFFLLLALVGVLIMMAGFPDGTPLRHGLTFTYNRVAAVRFLRASYKAAPLLAVGLACLAGAGAAQAAVRLRAVRGRVLATAAAVAGGFAILALAAWPLVSGRAQDRQVSFKAIPAAWREAAAGLDRTLPANARAIVLPGDLFSFYTWGGTVDPILPALSHRPVAERTEVPYADLRATDLLWTIDSLVHQQRLLPGQLGPLLRLIGAGAVITGTDDDPARSDAPPPADVASELASQPGFARASESYGPMRLFEQSGLGSAVSLPQVRRYDIAGGAGLIRVQPASAPTLVDGSADALAGLAAFGALPGGRALFYTPDLSADQLRRDAAGGGTVVISDSNRRQAFVASSLEQNTGPVLTADETVSADGIILDPFALGPSAQTVAVYRGIRSVLSPASPERPQFPEHAAFAALDGNAQTAWLADSSLDPSRRWLQVNFRAPTAIPYVDLLPYDDAGGSVRRVSVAGRSFTVHPGWNRLPLRLAAQRDLVVTITSMSPPAAGYTASAGGIRELRIPGIRASESLRLPVDAADALRGARLSAAGLDYLFARTTGDDPYRRDLAHRPWSVGDVHQPGDAETTLERIFELPVPRRFSADAWVNVTPQAPDSALDRLLGYHGPVEATSSSRFDGEPGRRASAALDGSPRTAWIGDWSGGPSWIAWRTRTPRRLSKLVLRPAPVPVRRPTSVRIVWPGGASGALAVGSRGTVELPHPIRAHSFRIEVLSAVAPASASAGERRAVGIGEIEGAPRLVVPRAADVPSACGAVGVRVGGISMPLRVSGSRAAFEAGDPLRAFACRGPVALAAGTQHLITTRGPFAVDRLLLSSPAPRPGPGASGSVLSAGIAGRGSYRDVRVKVSSPSWLVLGESFNRGWHASCEGHSLGAPVPIDGFANGWRVQPGCAEVSFTFSPNRMAAIGYLLSALAGLACVLLIVAGVVRARRRGDGPAVADPELLDTPAQARPALRSVAVALPAAALFAFFFGLRAGVVAWPVLAFVLWRGVGAPLLSLTAGALLAIVVPVLYVVDAPDSAGGNHYGYASQHMAAHWVGLAAIGLLILALWRELAARRLASREGAAPTPRR
jgi:arabinofuranan 3-O-arabinosyltransferase